MLYWAGAFLLLGIWYATKKFSGKKPANLARYFLLLCGVWCAAFAPLPIADTSIAQMLGGLLGQGGGAAGVYAAASMWIIGIGAAGDIIKDGKADMFAQAAVYVFPVLTVVGTGFGIDALRNVVETVASFGPQIATSVA